MTCTPLKKRAKPAQSKKIFEIDEESEAGGTSCCWVERHKDGYHLFRSELGKMCGPYETIHGALGFQFGMDSMNIETTLCMAEPRSILGDSGTFILSNVSRLTINGDEVDPEEFTDSTD
jgi:hypothetical protein